MAGNYEDEDKSHTKVIHTSAIFNSFTVNWDRGSGRRACKIYDWCLGIKLLKKDVPIHDVSKLLVKAGSAGLFPYTEPVSLHLGKQQSLDLQGERSLL